MFLSARTASRSFRKLIIRGSKAERNFEFEIAAALLQAGAQLTILMIILLPSLPYAKERKTDVSDTYEKKVPLLAICLFVVQEICGFFQFARKLLTYELAHRKDGTLIMRHLFFNIYELRVGERFNNVLLRFFAFRKNNL